MDQFNVRSIAYFRARRFSEPIVQRYQRMVEEFELHSNDARMRKLEQRVFGAKVIDGASQEYWVEQGRNSAKVSPAEWSEMSLEERGKVIAFVRLEAMADAVRRYIEIVTRK